MDLKYNKLYLNFTTDYNNIILSFSLKGFVELFNIKFYYARRKHKIINLIFIIKIIKRTKAAPTFIQVVL